MEKLEPSQLHQVSAAEGWVELGNLAEARAELERIAPPFQKHPRVLEVRWAVCASGEEWPAALDIARQLLAVAPDIPEGWLHRSYSLRRVAEGGLQAAWDGLLPALGKFPTNALIPYNLACYACLLGQVENARSLLRRAMKNGGKEHIKKLALLDPDLEKLWAEIRIM